MPEPQTDTMLFFRAICSQCEDSWDGDGAEFQLTPEKAIAAAKQDGGLTEHEGKWLCDDCEAELWRDVVCPECGVCVETELRSLHPELEDAERLIPPSECQYCSPVPDPKKKR